MSIYLPGREPKTRRLARLRIQGDLLLDLMRSHDGTKLLRQQGIPDDAKVVGIVTDRVLNIIELLLESDTFEEVKDGTWIPDIAVNYSVGYPLADTGDLLIFDVPWAKEA